MFHSWPQPCNAPLQPCNAPLIRDDPRITWVLTGNERLRLVCTRGQAFSPLPCIRYPRVLSQSRAAFSASCQRSGQNCTSCTRQHRNVDSWAPALMSHGFPPARGRLWLCHRLIAAMPATTDELRADQGRLSADQRLSCRLGLSEQQLWA